MATYRVGQKTHPPVLPQQVALEFESADTPRIGDETGLERREAPGAVHVRGETTGVAPGIDGVTPNHLVGERAREGHPVVFVLDKHGTPLQPTSPARARQLLKQRRAVVARHTPFVIRLKDRTVSGSQVDGTELGIDPGSKRTGISVFTAKDGERRGLYAVELAHRGAVIQDKLTARASYRRGRRTRNLRHRAPRFSNRARPKGWLAPSLRHRVDTTMSWTVGSRAGHPCARCTWSGSRSIPTPCPTADHCRGPSTSTAPCTAQKPANTSSPSGAGPAPAAAPPGYRSTSTTSTPAHAAAATASPTCARPASRATRRSPTSPSKTSCRNPRASWHASSLRPDKHFRLLQRADGYAYTTRPEGPSVAI